MTFRFPLILCGAMGTQMVKRGLQPGVCPEQWSLEHRNEVAAIQRAYVEAGSGIIYTPTFGANRVALERNKIFGKVKEYNEGLVSISREAAEGRAYLAGDLTSVGAMLYPMGNTRFEELVSLYKEQASALEEAGVDLFIIETITNVAEARAAVLAVKSVSDKPVFVTFTCDANGRTMTGTDICAALNIMQGMGVNAFGLNCSVGPKELVPQLKRLSEISIIPLIAKPNAGLPRFENGVNIYDVGPEEFASYVPDLAEAGVKFFGGCCGTDERYIAAIRSALDSLGKTEEEWNAPLHEAAEGYVLCSTERAVFELPAELGLPEAFACDDDLEDNLSDADPEVLIAIRIESEEDVELFEECQYAVRNPLCICCDDAVLLEKTLRIYQGRAVYSGSLDKEVLSALSCRYGLIAL